MLYEIKQGQTVLDVALLLYGSVKYAVKLVNENPLLVSIVNTNIVGITVTYDETVKGSIDADLNGLNTITKPIDNSYFVVQGQSVYDLAIQFGYGIDRIIEFMNLANYTGINQNISGVIDVPKIQNKTANNLFLTGRNLATALISLIPSGVRITTDSIARITTDGTYRITA